jgi:hypothetical protein
MRISTFFLISIYNLFFPFGTFAAQAGLDVPENIPSTFTEPFGCPSDKPKGQDCGIRYQVRNVAINGGGNIFRTKEGGEYNIEMEVLHDCSSCGNAINQIIVGLSTDKDAQVSVWNGKQRSGGNVMVVNSGTEVACYVEDNPNKAQWVKVYFKIYAPDVTGIYYLRTRYSQAYTGNLRTTEALSYNQTEYSEPLKWWRVDRPKGPTKDSNIGAIIVSK